ncbi:3-oxoacyl-ACP synthase [Nocardia sp. XZ_19_369]|uniref:3-oxoacyl-ACP synthase n=1 Tax=Nocardia sp. XZ_19_369 TaxID=2769487 RepID=UPI00188EFC03|nr:3-oxoacyl-ACP synthase [Nocardia sp. XZ_19_369]
MTAAAPITIGPVTSWFPDRTVPVGELPELAELSNHRRTHALSLGIDTIRCAGADTEVDIAAAAATAVLTGAGLAPGEIDALLLVQGRAPQYLLASEATRLQHRLGLRDAFVACVGDLGCVSVSAAFTLAAALLRGTPGCRTVLVVAAAKTPTSQRYRAPMTLLGDGGAAVVLSTVRPGRYELVDHVVRSDGKYADLFRIDYRDRAQAAWSEECASEPDYSFRLAVESKKRFAAMNSELLAGHGTTMSQVDAVVTQNLSVGAFAFWEEAMDVTIDQVCRRNLAAYGHLGSIDVLVNLEDAAATLGGGDHLLVLNSSPVAAWSSSLLRRLSDDAAVRR